MCGKGRQPRLVLSCFLECTLGDMKITSPPTILWQAVGTLPFNARAPDNFLRLPAACLHWDVVVLARDDAAAGSR